MPEVSSTAFSEIDGSNNAPSPSGFPEGMNMSGLNDSARAVMGATKRFWGRIQGRYPSTGSANAYVLTPEAALAAYVVGERYSFRANFTNSGTATVDISALGARTIQKMTASGLASLAAGDIQSGQPVTVEYNGSVMILVTPAANTLTDINGLAEDTAPSGANDFVATYDASAAGAKKVKINNLRPSFRGALVKKSTVQSIGTSAATNVTWDQEEYDTDSIHDNSTNNSRLTVPAGVTKVRLSASTQWASSNTTGIRTLTILKGGTTFQGTITSIVEATNNSTGLGFVQSAVVAVTAGEYFELSVFQDSGSALNLAGSDNRSWFAMEILE